MSTINEQHTFKKDADNVTVVSGIKVGFVVKGAKEPLIAVGFVAAGREEHIIMTLEGAEYLIAGVREQVDALKRPKV